MLAEPTTLLFFVAEKSADRKPLEWFFKFALMRRHYPRQCWGELRPHCHLPLAFVDKIEKLINDFGAAFLFIQLRRLQDRSVPFDKTVATGHFPPL